MPHAIPPPRGIETAQSWVVACVALLVLSIAYGAPLVTVVALAPIAAEFGTQRAAPALAVSLTYIGSGLGGIAMGWLAGRIGMRTVAMGCGLMIALGLALASGGGLYRLYACNLLLLGLARRLRHVLPDHRLCHTLVRPPPRLRRRLRLLRPIRCRSNLAGAVCNSASTATAGAARCCLYGIVIAVTIPTLAGLFYRTPPDAAADPAPLRPRTAARSRACRPIWSWAS